MTKSRIKDWILQFQVDDRELILKEISHIFKKRYLSKQYVLGFWKYALEKISQAEGITSVNDFLNLCTFIRTQKEGKSQYAMLEVLDIFLKTTYNIKLDDSGTISHKYSIYVDDVLCTGQTFVNDIRQWTQEEFSDGVSNYEAVKKGDTKLILCYIFIHNKNYNKKIAEFKYKNLEGIASNIKAWSIWIDNSENKTDSKIEIIKPLKDGTSQVISDYENTITEQVNKYCEDRNYNVSDSDFYREADMPKEETFFTTPENRKKVENIFLEKGIEILQNANSCKDNIRALGFSLPSHKDFGYGAMCFTWRNVPNNTPLVFWYNGGGFLPLFDVKRDSNQFDLDSILKSYKLF